ncbi:trafficking kinesin-binding protein 1-like isoform X2 [Limulus polyphemus]|nr:trafficking kinesin-binding protein 1-like isoform X2 [Limulus polyphemus]XP_022241412.1 trafficking kinesin-binding protein 1-like isoform X2 [Limulus polyphemus]XP_022241413.1 trafficking kinesin-binding protein 1-like isoform X2 [Limulus polyphemus]XP_022241414.1 trafficking kinesin-binding protein 1-like isoform X2 [Limulus polyphemus]XP_022241415.1 trafficking kinesin-binding protein 1-like isoform X2 [Limulus polyphemus]XP_022241416.1 trafficking kinesin-binding protein 1-like isoform
MTKAYNDIEAVTKLLEEKEGDLELAARIGQTLLDKNKDLQQKNEQLEHDLTIANENITQLRHDLALKNGLLQIYTQDLDTDSESGSPTKERGMVNWELLTRKVQDLEKENIQLRQDAVMQSVSIEEEEKKEMQLINDFVKELNDLRVQNISLQEDLGKKVDDNYRQQEEITHLLTQAIDLQRKVRLLTTENEELQTSLQTSKECQNELSQELIDMKEKYAELADAFQELQEEVRKVCRNRLPKAKRWTFEHSTSLINPDSLASELESSVNPDSDGYISDEKMSRNKRVFQTVKLAGKSKFGRSRRQDSERAPYTPDMSPHLCLPKHSQPVSLTVWSRASFMNDGSLSDSESAYADSYQTDDDGQFSSISSLGRPGAPGSTDFEAALRRMSSGVATGTDTSSEDETALIRCHSPDSLMSGPRYGTNASTFRRYHIPEKLQIIKPLEGSQTLHHWQQLATPHLGGIFEDRPGVQIKGEHRMPELEPETFTLSDLEEDEDFSNPGKSFVNTCSVYTYTNSTVLHPTDQTRVTPSYLGLQLAVRAMSQPPSTLNSPEQRHEQATSTYSTMLGLAKVLNERGIHAIVPTASTSQEKEVSPTPTPTPSPDGSPPPYGLVKIPDLLTGSAIRRKLHLFRTPRSQKQCSVSTAVASGTLTTDDKTSTTVVGSSGNPSIGLMEKLSQIGLENIMTTTGCGVASYPQSSRRSRLPSPYGLSSIPDSSPLTLTANVQPESEILERQSDNSQGRLEPLKTPATTVSTLSHPWGYVPPMVFGKGAGLTPAISPPLSRMPNPLLQINSLRRFGVGNQHIGTLETLRTLRKGGFT